MAGMKLGKELKTACISVCHKPFTRGVSCSKIVLVDFLCENCPQKSHRSYTIIDAQSNASMITPDLANRLAPTRPNIKYFLTTCSGGREEKAGKRIFRVMLWSKTSIMARLPQLLECTNIPEDKRKIAMPEMAIQCSHLKETAHEIPPYDPKANVEILTRRDAPELLKITAGRNGPKGASWAQKLDMGWTISSQMCLNWVSGPAHISSTPHNNGALRQVGYQLSLKCARKICRAGRNQGQPLSIDTWWQFG